MGDMGDYWRDHREYVQQKKQKYRANMGQAIDRLTKSGFSYQRFSPDHYRVEGVYDWWPSTGYWKEVNGKQNGYGVSSLIKELKVFIGVK